MTVLRTVAPYCLSKETLNIILNADPYGQKAHLTGLAKNAQQFIKYQLFGTVGNYMGEKVLARHNVFPSGSVRKHLGLTGDNTSKSFMDM
jgi:hypothetical protein